MRCILRIFVKDARRFWGGLAGLGLVLGLSFVHATQLPDLSKYAYDSDGKLLSNLLFYFLLALTALVFVEDSPGDRRAFSWTRPIAPLSLLRAKVLFVCTFLIGLPLITQALAEVHLGAGRAILAQSAWTALLKLLPWLTVSAALAGLFRGFPELVAAAVLGVAAWVVADSLWAWALDDLARSAVRDLQPLYLLVGGAAALVHQYRTRMGKRSAAILAFTVFLAPLLIVPLPNHLFWTLHSLGSETEPIDFECRLQTGDAAAVRQQGGTDRSRTWLGIPAHVEFPEGHSVHLEYADSRLDLPAQRLHSAVRTYGQVYSADLQAEAIRKGRKKTAVQVLPALGLAPETFRRLRDQVGRLQTRFFFSGSRVETIPLELRVGGRFQDDRLSVEIESVQASDGALEVGIRGREWIVHGNPIPAYHFDIEFSEPATIAGLPVPGDGGRAVNANSSGPDNMRFLLLDGSGIRYFRLRLKYDVRIQGKPTDGAWLLRSKLNVLRYRTPTYFTRRLRIDSHVSVT